MMTSHGWMLDDGGVDDKGGDAIIDDEADLLLEKDEGMAMDLDATTFQYNPLDPLENVQNINKSNFRN